MEFLSKSVIRKSIGWNNGANVDTPDRTPQMDAGSPLLRIRPDFITMVADDARMR